MLTDNQTLTLSSKDFYILSIAYLSDFIFYLFQDVCMHTHAHTHTHMRAHTSCLLIYHLTDFLAIPPKYQVYFYLRAFTLAAPCDCKTIFLSYLGDLLSYFIQGPVL